MFGLFKTSSRRAADTRAYPLLNLSRHDVMTAGDLLNGGVSVFGQSGSGKSSGSGKALAEAIVAMPHSGGLILAAKPEDRGFWLKVFADAKRSDDLLIFGTDEPLRFNFLDYEAKAGGHARNITRTIMVIGETLRSADNKGSGEDGDFWEKQQERMLYNAVVVVKLATGRVSAPDLQKFITTAAQTPQQLVSEEWQAGFHNATLKSAFEREKSAIDAHDFQLAMDYWAAEAPAMADRTKSSILAGVLGILHTFNTGIVRELVSTTTNVSSDVIFDGKWVLVNMPPAEWGDIGAFVAAGWKYLTQRAVLRRHVKAGDNVVTIWGDEAAQWVNSFDAHYLSQCRSHQGCMVYLAQSLHSYYSVLKGQAGKHQADALLTNFHTKIFHSLGDVQSSEWAASLVGRSLQTFVGGSTQRDEDAFGLLIGNGGGSSSFSEHFESILQPNEFMHGLRSGGPEHDYLCDAIVIRSGKPFASGQNWIKVAFPQR